MENETLKIQAIERERMTKRLMATLNNDGEYQNWQFVKTRSWLSKQNLQLQTNSIILPLEETIEDWNEA